MTPHRILLWLNRLFLPTVTWLKMAVFACVVSGCGRPDDAGYALVVDESQWSGFALMDRYKMISLGLIRVN